MLNLWKGQQFKSKPPKPTEQEGRERAHLWKGQQFKSESLSSKLLSPLRKTKVVTESQNGLFSRVVPVSLFAEKEGGLCRVLDGLRHSHPTQPNPDGERGDWGQSRRPLRPNKAGTTGGKAKNNNNHHERNKQPTNPPPPPLHATAPHRGRRDPHLEHARVIVVAANCLRRRNPTHVPLDHGHRDAGHQHLRHPPATEGVARVKNGTAAQHRLHRRLELRDERKC